MIKPKKNTISILLLQTQCVSFTQPDPSLGPTFSKPWIQSVSIQPALKRYSASHDHHPPAKNSSSPRYKIRKLDFLSLPPTGFQQIGLQYQNWKAYFNFPPLENEPWLMNWNFTLPTTTPPLCVHGKTLDTKYPNTLVKSCWHFISISFLGNNTT